MNFWEEIKRRYQVGAITTRLLYVNIGVFVIIKLLSVIVSVANPSADPTAFVADWLAVPAYLPQLIYRPWTLITYQFLHFDFMHLLFNMVFLYSFGQLFIQKFSQRQVLSVYLWGGIWGGVFYLLSFNFLPYYKEGLMMSQMIGASASLLALVLAPATASPNEKIRLMFIGDVKLKYMAIGIVIMDLMSITSDNAGGHIAHLGGAFAGFWFAHDYLKRNKDMTAWIAKMVDFFATYFKTIGQPRKPKMKARKTGGKKADMQFNKHKLEKQVQVDHILEKVKATGYSSLSKAEKEQLFKASK